jgi:pre-rRNA-processing protein IPI3
VSISEDKSAIVWDYHSGQALRTYLLPEAPTAVALDPADRAFYVAYEDGSLQVVDFYDETQQSSPTDTLRETSLSHRPVQTSTKRRFNAESQKLGGALSLSLSWDGTTLVSGHVSGKIAAWDIAKGNYISTLSSLVGPVTNVQFLPPTGFPNAPEHKLKIHTIVKPKQDTGAANAGNGLIPANYTLNVQLTGRLSAPAISATEKRKTEKSEFEEALTHPVFPLSMLEESLAELESWNTHSNGTVAPSADFLSLSADNDPTTSNAGVAKDAAEMNELKKQLASLQRIQKVTFSQLAELREEKEWFVRKEKKRAARKHAKARKASGIVNGDHDGDVEMSEDGSSASESESNDSAITEDSDEEEEEEEEESGADSSE